MDNGARVLVSGYSPAVKYVFVVWGFFAVAYFLWLLLFFGFVCWFKKGRTRTGQNCV